MAPVDNLDNCLFFEFSCVFGSLHLHFSNSDFDNNICLLNWGNAIYRWVVVAGGSFVIALLGVYWLLDRSGLKFF